METIEYKGYKIQIDYDNGAENPRVISDNLSEMICFHNRYSLGDEHAYKTADFNGWNELKKQIVKDNDPAVILPLYLYDHGGITISTSPFSCNWDSGQVGWVFISKKAARDYFMVKTVTEKIREKCLASIKDEMETYDAYLVGDVYSALIVSHEGEEVDFWCGFYGDPETSGLIEEAKRSIDDIIK